MSLFTQYSVEEFQRAYTVKEQIGKGGAGVVFRAQHNRLLKDVVIKKLNDVIKDDGQQRAEVDILKNLRHPYLPQVYDFFTMNGSCFTVMEFIKGSSIKQLLDQNMRFSEQQIIKYSRQLSEVVSYLHSQALPVIHGDIKPDNIIITPEDNICLIDFNISSVSTGGVAWTFGCTRGYSAPEQVSAYERLKAIGGNPSNSQGVRIDKRSDVFSIGATMYHMYAGERLDKSSGIKVSDVQSDALVNIINTALRSNPNERYQDAGELYDAICQINNKDNEIKRISVAFGVIRFLFALLAMVGILLIIYGYTSLDGERNERYYDYIGEMEDAREEGDEDALLKYYKLAISMQPENAQAYYQVAAYYYDIGDYYKAIDYIHGEVPSDSYLTEDDYIAGINDIYAECFFEEQNYEDACDAWETAIKYNDEVPAYYRNLAVSYTLCGNADDARDILDKADKYGISDDGIYLIRGEINNAEGEYEDAIDDFEECIDITEDDRTMYLAFVGYSEAITGLAEGEANANTYYEQNIALLNRGASQVSDQYRLSLLKRTADIARIAYLENQDNEVYANEFFLDATSAYSQIENTGWMNEVEYYNYVDLYIKTKNFDKAMEIQLRMDNAFEESLLAAESHAFLERQIQLDKPVDQRDYTEFCNYYRRAQSIADTNGTSDERLVRLAEIYREVV